jgi:hypothetical protein
MTEVPLDDALDGAQCPRCGIGRIRIVDVVGGTHLTIQCPIPRCRWRGRAPLPQIRKKLIYLDTATVSDMAKALHRGESDSALARLYDALRRASALEVISCPSSTIVRDEIELSSLSSGMLEIARQLGGVALSPQIAVHEAQLFRALDRYLAGDPPTLETSPPPEDAFRGSPHAWLPAYHISANFGSPAASISRRRQQKRRLRDEFEAIYQGYADSGDDLATIRASEARGFGKGILANGERVLRQRLGLLPVHDEEEAATSWLPTTFDYVVATIAEKRNVGPPESVRVAVDFLGSDHPATTPYADCNARLHAAVAMCARGPSPRRQKESDLFDLHHIATFVPYFDVLITDSFFASICNQGNVRVGRPWGTMIRSLRPHEMADFIAWIEDLVRDSEVAPLAQRVHDLTAASLRDFAEKLGRILPEGDADPESISEDQPT